jgi:hypothetical protein
MRPDPVRLVTEIDLASFVRAGLTELNGEPHLFLSDYRDLEETSPEPPETYFLVLVDSSTFEAFEQEYALLRTRPGGAEQASKRRALWSEFRQRTINVATAIWRAKRNFAEVARLEDEGRGSEVADSGWVLKERVSLDRLRDRLRCVTRLEERVYGEPLHPQDALA